MGYIVLRQFPLFAKFLPKSFRETIGPPRFTESGNRFLIVNSCVARKPLDVRSRDLDSSIRNRPFQTSSSIPLKEDEY
jgi:hypothetical protein